MSLDVYLMLDGERVYGANITHNLNTMASEAGCYEALWRPDEHGMEEAHQIVANLREGLLDLLSNPIHYKSFNPENGWWSYDGLVSFIVEYLKACNTYPNAKIEVSR